MASMNRLSNEEALLGDFLQCRDAGPGFLRHLCPVMPHHVVLVHLVVGIDGESLLLEGFQSGALLLLEMTDAAFG